MKVHSFDIPGLMLIEPRDEGDALARFTYFFDRREFSRLGLPVEFVQEHGSRYHQTGTVRGLHAQRGHGEQIKLVRVASGRIHDVVVDVRRGSPTYGRHESIELSADDRRMLLVPIGLAHGFCTLEPDTEVVFRLTNYNDRETQCGLLWNDPALGIDWPCGDAPAHLFELDRTWPTLAQYPPAFSFRAPPTDATPADGSRC
ncbi:MAG: dTDP-4-dehydrorhamnose 3,5-epimerase [Burkholderiaceae bacterium]